mmetsp:Transcript_112680/g.206801  ORF Transcript_112680/g.206801 Transcript_112680/m.206801 type:complete len:280 (+) Transcript_112680:1166-2005(+)
MSILIWSAPGKALKSPCFFFQPARAFCHCDHFSLNQLEGSRFSATCVFLHPRIQDRKYAALSAASCQTYLISSKPSSSPGRLNPAYKLASTDGLRSGTACVACNLAFISSGAAPMATTATLRNLLVENCASAALLSSAVKLDFSSMTTKLRLRAGASTPNTFWTLRSSMDGTPKAMPGLSVDSRDSYPRGLASMLRFAQSRTLRSLSSTYSGCFSRKSSSHAKMPSSGRPMGKITSHLSTAGMGATSMSASAASFSMRHLKGSSLSGAGPKFTCNVTFL